MTRRASLPLIAVGAAIVLGASWALADRLEDTLFIPLDHPAIQYASREPNDAVARLEQRLENKQVKLDFAPNSPGYLPALLKELNVPVDSQVLVFSKTSIQANHISPRAPRAIYFNDEVSVGYVPEGDVLELSSLDPRQGVKFYTMDVDQDEKPTIARRDECLQCHQGPVTLAVPGLLISSVHPSTPGSDGHGNAFMTDHRTRFTQRWGGWYVTGTHGSEQVHLGNNPNLTDPIHPGPGLREGTQNVTNLGQRFAAKEYLASTSDIVALMVLEHQVRMTNLMIRIGWDHRVAGQEGKLDTERKQLDTEIEEMVAYMLFGDEDQLKEPVAGVSTFSKTFPQRGPRDKQGRSLRDFDLKTRLFRYPLSYMIYSAAFDALPDVVHERAYRLLYDILTGKDQRKDVADHSLARLNAQDKQAILEILRATKTNLPAYWAAAVETPGSGVQK